MIGHWNDHEEDALQGLPIGVQLLYLRGLRRYMDAKTGLVGVRRGVSLGQLSETLYEEPCAGVGMGGRPSKDQVRRMIRRLIKAGLLVSKTSDRRLIFFLPLAFVDKSVKNQVATRPPQGRHTQAATYNNKDNNSLDEQAATRPPHGRHTQAATPQQSTVNNYSVARDVSNLPRARVDRIALLRCLGELGFQHMQVHTPKVMAIIDRWVDERVTEDEIRLVYQMLVDRSAGNRHFGPAYLDRPISEYRQARQQQSGGNRHAAHQPVQRAKRDTFAERLFGSPDPGLSAVADDSETVGDVGGEVWPIVDQSLDRFTDAAPGPGGMGGRVVKIHG